MIISCSPECRWMVIKVKYFSGVCVYTSVVFKFRQ